MATRQRMTRRTLGLSGVSLAMVALFAVLVPLHISLYGQQPAFAFLLGGALCGAPLLAIPAPRSAIAVFCVSACALPLPVLVTHGTTWPWPWSVPALIALVAFIAVLAFEHGWLLALISWLVSIGGTLGVAIALASVVPLDAAIVDLIVVTSVSGGALLVAVLVASRLRVGAELTREREVSASEQSRRVLVEERTRIARELHDVVAHGMSLIQVQASTARYRVPELSDAAVAEFEDIARTAREGLAEMRRLLGVLRTEDQPAVLAPQQGLGDIPELVRSARRAGATVAFDDADAAPPGHVPGTVGITAFRIVQEALSNAMRHAPDAPIELTVQTGAEAVDILVRNALGPDAAPPSPRGHGLRGMRERAALAGGRVDAGPDPTGGWTVRAVLPMTHETEEP